MLSCNCIGFIGVSNDQELTPGVGEYFEWFNFELSEFSAEKILFSWSIFPADQ